MFNLFFAKNFKKTVTRSLRRVRPHVDPHSLQFRLTLGAALVALVGTGAVSGWMSWQTEKILIGSHKQTIHEIADGVPQDIKLLYQDTMTIDGAVQRAIDSRSLPNLSLALATEDGHIQTKTEGEWYQEDVIEFLLVQTSTLPPSVIMVNNQHYVVCSQPITVDNQVLGSLHIALNMTDDQLMFKELTRTLTLVTLLVMGLMAAVIALYVQRSLRPLRQMSQQTSTLSLEELAHHPLEPTHAPTEVKELVETCEHALSRLASALEHQQQFVRDISHELRTPLSIVSGYLQSLLRRSKTFSEPQREALETAAAEADHTIRLLQDLLNLERAGSGHTSFKRSPIILDELVDDVVRMAIISSYRDINLDLRSSTPVEVETDPDRLKQVLAQLVDNAIKYSDEDQLVTVRLDQTDSHAIIQVCDRGVGIPLQHQSRIFDQCYRVDSNRSRKTGGCGIGLSLAKVFVEGMGGTVSVRSKPQEGSIFTVTLPISQHYDHTNRSRRRRRKASPVR